MLRLETFGLAGIIGWPVQQSRSPTIHNHWIERYGLTGRYVLLPVRPDALEAALRGLPALGFRGCNVTMPHKLAVMPLLDRVDGLAQRSGAVNTVTVEADGSLSGSNSDGAGWVQSLVDAKPGWMPGAGPAVLLGAGGAARAVVAALAAGGAREIRIVNRTLEKAQEIAAAFPGTVTAYRWEDRAEVLAAAALVANATDQGMAGKPPLAIDLARLPPDAVVSDLIYSPLETPFLAAAKARGNMAVNGLGMLLNQARPAFAGWFGVMPEITAALRRAVEATF